MLLHKVFYIVSTLQHHMISAARLCLTKELLLTSSANMSGFTNLEQLSWEEIPILYVRPWEQGEYVNNVPMMMSGKDEDWPESRGCGPARAPWSAGLVEEAGTVRSSESLSGLCLGWTCGCSEGRCTLSISLPSYLKETKNNKHSLVFDKVQSGTNTAG